MSLEHGVKEKYKRDNPKSKKFDKKIKPVKSSDNEVEASSDQKKQLKTLRILNDQTENYLKK